ncbi:MULTISPECIES: carboxymuconolactone decarboxylase family protein [unclassified Mesorhizobium]|uniref:carboxymuconolactone decarboxylase family protein n=1 Tax=unclassified Mesorhizobium TaxID=325217 RepID=UPI001FE23D83|nr:MULTISPECIES: carboxymuconolactone decarboxylase family protein [unclassified Mesorhizobium]
MSKTGIECRRPGDRRMRIMQQGFDFQTAESAFDAVNAIRTLEEAVKNCGFEQSLIVLVKMRASQINGCACRIHSHIRNARLHGETEERLRVLHAWRDPAMPFRARECAALAWTEALTVLSTTHVTDAIHQQAREQFDRDELAKLTLLVGTTNLWDRLAIGFRSVLHAAGETCSDASTGCT